VLGAKGRKFASPQGRAERHQEISAQFLNARPAKVAISQKANCSRFFTSDCLLCVCGVYINSVSQIEGVFCD
jgi:hypothetical protein